MFILNKNNNNNNNNNSCRYWCALLWSSRGVSCTSRCMSGGSGVDAFLLTFSPIQKIGTGWHHLQTSPPFQLNRTLGDKLRPPQTLTTVNEVIWVEDWKKIGKIQGTSRGGRNRADKSYVENILFEILDYLWSFLSQLCYLTLPFWLRVYYYHEFRAYGGELQDKSRRMTLSEEHKGWLTRANLARLKWKFWILTDCVLAWNQMKP